MKRKKTVAKKKIAASPRSRRTASGISRAARPRRKASPRRPAAEAEKPETPTLRVRRQSRRDLTLKIPSILLEGDRPAAPAIGGPGQRYALGPTAPVEHFEAEGELPEAYGTQRLLLTARDPHWLYAHWDLTREQQLKYNSLSADKHLILRVRMGLPAGPLATETHVHPESRHWFVHVDRAGTTYLAELGFYRRSRQWHTISTSGPTFAPSDTVSPDTTAEFATIPIELPMAKLLSLVKEAVQQNVPLAQALTDLRAQGHPELPELSAHTVPPAPWTPAQERALAEVISMDRVRRVWMGSMEITELIRRQAARELASMAAAAAAAPGVPTSPAGISSPVGRAQAEKGFWFNVNAELIIYGATEANAAVSIGGRRIKLRPDGSFSYRFALPDGQYELPVVAVAADGTDGRAAEMTFSRRTERRGDVGAHAQDPALRRPEAASL